MTAPIDAAMPPRRLGWWFWASTAWIALLVFVAIFADWLPLRDPDELGIISREVESFERPGWNAFFGADSSGRDLFSNVVHGARPALLLGLVVTLVAALLGGALGVIAGYAKGWVDTVIMTITDTALAFPALVLLIAVRASFGNSMTVFIVIFSLLGIPGYARIVRGATLALSEREFVEAARSMGASASRIVLRELVPNVALPVVSFAFLGFAIVIAAEGGLAFIGLSLDQTTWGQLIVEGMERIQDHPHLALIPSTAMFLTILAFNFVGDGIRQLALPRLVATARRPAPVAVPIDDRGAAHGSLLSIRNLHTSLATPRGVVHPVHDVSIEVGPGEALAIVGESGSGKTMVLRSVLGTFPVANVSRSGVVEFDGEDLLRIDQRRRRQILGTRIGTISQNPLTALNPVRRIGVQITEPMRVHLGLGRGDARRRAIGLLEQVGIPDPEKRYREYPHQLSGGMRQRVTIAIALANDPDLLLADEPTTALDVTVQDQILRLLSDLRSEVGMATILVTHDLAVVKGFADRVVIMYAGEVVESGPTDQIFAHPRHQYTVALMRSLPDLTLPSHTELAVIEGQPPSLIDPPGGCRFVSRCPAVQDDRYRSERCASEAPPAESASGSDAGSPHVFACWFPAESPVDFGASIDAATGEVD